MKMLSMLAFLFVSFNVFAAPLEITFSPGQPSTITADLEMSTGLQVPAPWISTRFFVINNENYLITLEKVNFTVISQEGQVKQLTYWLPPATKVDKSFVSDIFSLASFPKSGSQTYNVHAELIGWDPIGASPITAEADFVTK